MAEAKAKRWIKDFDSADDAYAAIEADKATGGPTTTSGSGRAATMPPQSAPLAVTAITEEPTPPSSFADPAAAASAASPTSGGQAPVPAPAPAASTATAPAAPKPSGGKTPKPARPKKPVYSSGTALKDMRRF